MLHLIMTHTHSHSRTPLYEGSVRRRDLCLTTLYTHTHKREIIVQPARFEAAIPASESPQTHVLDSAATGIVINRT